ncbi:MAG: Flp pilus assembly protein CpaB [Planctomycetaceae bacterium]|nr:Flp pilus assembly protein CpaB [Planctomycetaceae bacterium]
MKPKTLVLLAVAGGCGLLAMLGVQQAMQGSGNAPKVQTVRVLVATGDVDSGTRLSPDNVAFQQKPIDSVPEDAVLTQEEYEERAAKIPMLAGDIVRKTALTEKGGYGRSIEIPPGMRVITISVDSTHTASGLIRPGDRIDVLVNYRSKSERGLPVSKTKTLLEYIEVFATDNQTASKLDDGNSEKSSQTKYVSLLLTPEQVNFVKLAETKGTLSLSWRHRLDDELVQTKDIDDKLLEELEGTVGVNEDRPLYDQSFSAPFADSETIVDAERREDLGISPEGASQRPSQFLDSVQQNANGGVTATAGIPQTIVAAPQINPENLWTIQVYNGNTPMPQQFEITPASETKPVEPSGSLTDFVKGLWGSGQGASSTQDSPGNSE